MKCPHCRKEIDISLEKLEYHKNGRTLHCPHEKCKKKIMLTRTAKNLTYDKNGTLEKKFVPRIGKK